MLTIFRNGQLDFHREIVMGDNDFTKAIIGTIFHEGKAIQFSMEEAEEFKNKFGYPLGFVDSMSFKGAPLSELGAMMRPVMERLTGEIQRSIGFYSDKTKGDSVSALYLIGKGSKIKHLDQVLNSRVGIPVARLPVPRNITIAGNKKQKGMFKNKFLDHTVSLAVALESGFQGSLLPGIYRIRQLQSKIKKIGTILGLVLLGIAFISASKAYLKTKGLQKEIKIAERVALEAETAERRYARALTQQKNIDEEIAAIHKRVEQDDDLLQILRLFSNKLPNELLISLFEYRWEVKKAPSSTTPKKGQRVSAAAENKEETPKSIRKLSFEGGSTAPGSDIKIAVADFLLTLQESGYFETVELTDELMQESNDKNKSDELYWFEAEAVLKE
ncbi:MAG: hypothetical protein JXB24_06960 [Bacteroidales bacterium]|nr:hypothetical protein [Bacteroidales bacterium]